MEQANNISIVIPVLNERTALPENLESLMALKGVREIVIVDGGSSDGTLEYLTDVCRNQVNIRVNCSQPGRGVQMNNGAKNCSSEWLLFHHADTRIEQEGLEQIKALPREIQWGGFTHAFAPTNWKLRMVSWLHNFRCRKTGVIYGDQSMFVRKAFFDAIGGFPDHSLEDLAFSDLALEQQPSVLLPHAIQTESRKFIQMGEFQATWHVICIILRYQWSRQIKNEAFFRPYR